MKPLAAFVCAVLVLAGTVSIFAYQETHKGTVISVGKDTVRVNVLDPRTKETAPQNFDPDLDEELALVIRVTK